MNDYIPRPGDIVKFPGAPVKASQDRLYEIKDVLFTGDLLDPAPADITTIKFRLWSGDSTHVYVKSIRSLRAIGMKCALSVDKLDPTWKGE